MTGTMAKDTFENAVSLTGYGKFNIIVLLASGGCLMTVIIETMSMMFVVPASQCDLKLNIVTKGILSAISFLGVVLSSHFWGFIADTRGRRNLLIISMVGSCITSVSTSIVPYAWLFILIRFINGLCVGGASASVYAYLSEFHDTRYRPKVISWVSTFVAVGNMVIPGFAWLILPLDINYSIPFLDIDFRPWRLLTIAYGSPSLLFALWLLRLPESPKYLVAQGRLEEALDILRYMYSMNTGKPKNEFPITEFIRDDEVGSVDNKKYGILKSMWIQTAPLFKTPYLSKTLMVCLLQFGAYFTSAGLLMWYPEILNRMAFFGKETNNSTISMCNAIDHYKYHIVTTISEEVYETSRCDDSVDSDVYPTMLTVGSVFGLAFIVLGTIINIVGPKRLVIIFLVVTTCCGFAAQYAQNQIMVESFAVVFLTVCMIIGIINCLVVDLFPTQMRAMALGISLMVGRFGAVAGSNISGPLIYNLCHYLFYVYAAVHFVMIVTIFLLPSPPSVKKMIVPKV